jgi:hypothetical protein
LLRICGRYISMNLVPTQPPQNLFFFLLFPFLRC